MWANKDFGRGSKRVCNLVSTTNRDVQSFTRFHNWLRSSQRKKEKKEKENASLIFFDVQRNRAGFGKATQTRLCLTI